MGTWNTCHVCNKRNHQNITVWDVKTYLKKSPKKAIFDLFLLKKQKILIKQRISRDLQYLAHTITKQPSSKRHSY